MIADTDPIKAVALIAAERRAREEEAKRAEESKRKAQAKVLAEFRKNLKVGDETNCGPIIEIRRPMVKVYKPIRLPGYPNEHWLRVTDLFPAIMGSCDAHNGQLISSGP